MIHTEHIINDNSSTVLIYRNFLNNVDAINLLNTLIQDVKWEQHTHKLGTEPRLSSVMGDVTAHTYSGVSRTCNPWHTIIKCYCNYINNNFQNANMNSALLNYYRNGGDYIAFHSDIEVTPPENYVFALSLGATRNFIFKRKSDNFKIQTKINNGDLMVMLGETQNLYQHSVTKHTGKVAESIGPRISITFRNLKNKN